MNTNRHQSGGNSQGLLTWSIGIYAGPSPFHLSPLPGVAQPVFAPGRMPSHPSCLMADPFLIRKAGLWHMFLEVKPARGQPAAIAHATSADGRAWDYHGTVLKEPFHLSYPYVFQWENEFFMIPETLDAGAIRLYRADPFPARWRLEGDLIRGTYADPTPFRAHDRWWLFACPRPWQHDVLHLYSAERISGPWRPHAENPLIHGDASRARPGGRVIQVDGRWIRWAQDCHTSYGHSLRAFEILELTPHSYRERELPASPVLQPGQETWNHAGMHHLDAHRLDDGSWLACVDGRGTHTLTIALGDQAPG